MNLNHIRQRLEAREQSLSPYATRVIDTAGRSTPEEPHPYRTEFQRDRDRIIHTNTFRRLKHKSQVFLAPRGDHYTTRLTHTIEVQQVARTIARALNLNEDLVEATALGHDLGHTPFGHIGEKVLDRLLDGGFHHSRQSVRVVESLEKAGRGLNLTREVIEGIRRHSKPQGDFLSREAVDGMSLEAQTVRVSDALAYLTHDINDAIRAGAITIDDLPTAAIKRLGARHSQRVDAVITGIIEGTLQSMADADTGGQPPVITMPDDLATVTNDLRDFMFERVYLPLTDSEQGLAAQKIVEALFSHYVANPDEVTPEIRSSSDSPQRAAADMVCGMTDDFALRRAEEITPGISGNAFGGRI
ncbi:MAG: deoxyguanosinetriphosphate triphosphohydrolase [Chloroflexi bacterium]|nr:deoxyguanosinetriphosphate triphosphohydrolase [Chloroflexota bacterium]